jgi:hypothetical protein
MTEIVVTPEQVRAAKLEVEALNSAGLTPDPLVIELAKLHLEARPIPRPAGYVNGVAHPRVRPPQTDGAEPLIDPSPGH